MQRALVILAVFLLVTVALAAGALAAHWPFWVRAWQWHAADGHWPGVLPGPTQVLRGGTLALPLRFETGSAIPATDGSTTQLLLVAGADGRGTAFLAPGYRTTSLIDGRGLASGLLAPLFGLLESGHPDVLHTADVHNPITPQQLLWQLSGFPAGKFQPLNPLSLRSQLASGPDFERAALRWRQTWPAGSHFEESAVNQQLLAATAARLTGKPYALLLEQALWSQFASGEAVAMRDHLRGSIAAHCCIRASAEDWLRLGLLLADDGRVGSRQLLPSGFVDRMAADSPVHPGYGLGFRVAETPVAGRVLALETTGRQLLVAPALRRALLWIGSGPAPAGLHQLLGAEAASGDRPASE
jgi:hypothetical protein